jgi:hypothetical protein
MKRTHGHRDLVTMIRIDRIDTDAVAGLGDAATGVAAPQLPHAHFEAAAAAAAAVAE